MSRKLTTDQEGAAPVISLRLSPALAAALAAEAQRRSAAAGGVPVSAAAVARVLLERALDVGAMSSAPTMHASAAQEAAQSPRRAATTPKPRGAATPTTPPPAAAEGDAQVPLFGGLDAAAIARHDERGRQHTELARVELLRSELGAARDRTRLSVKKIGAAVGCCDGSVIRFLDRRTRGWPKWGDAARAWLDTLPKQGTP